jgi:hypothetical protein
MQTINIKGKEYITVSERLKEFRSTHKDYCLITDIIELGADYATVKATIIDDKGNIRATGFAREVVAKSPLNKYAFLENCETSAIGRCLGNFGIGIDKDICTADEMIIKLSQGSTEQILSDTLKSEIQEANDKQALKDIYNREYNSLETASLKAELLSLLTQRKKELNNENS